MKKILLLLISGLILLCMAGSAIAGDTVLKPDPVTLINGKAEVVTSILITTPGTYQTEVYTSNNELKAYLDSSYPIAVGDSNNWVSVTPVLCLPYTVSKIPTTYTGTLYIEGTKGGTVTVRTGDSDGNHIIKEYSVENVGVSVPEFPTVAAPIAGIIGLLFIFGRKKEGL